MSITLTWRPNTESDIASYNWQRSSDAGGVPGTWADLVNIPHDIGGPNWDATIERFFYEDDAGTGTNWYRVNSVDQAGNSSAYSVAFQPTPDPPTPPFPNTVSLNEDYGAANAYQYTDGDGVPIPDAQIRIYKKADYDAENFGAAVGVTTTDTNGSWTNPVTVEAGFTYTIQFFKPGAFGPDTAEVVVP